jgi:hypothetical protein
MVTNAQLTVTNGARQFRDYSSYLGILEPQRSVLDPAFSRVPPGLIGRPVEIGKLEIDTGEGTSPRHAGECRIVEFD